MSVQRRQRDLRTFKGHSIRSFCKYHSRLSLALKLPKDLPSKVIQDRFFAEPLCLLILDHDSFVSDSAGELSLKKSLQDLLYRYLPLQIAPWIILSDASSSPSATSPLKEKGQVDAGSSSNNLPVHLEEEAVSSQAEEDTDHGLRYLAYIRQIEEDQPPPSLIEQFGMGYLDSLQSPLQPLTDNLESVTYEVFDKDPIKYAWYEKAITAVLKDWKSQGRSCSGPKDTVIIVVAGSGRGPLVTRALRAIQSTGVKAEVWAVEKNPNALVLLNANNVSKFDLHADPPGWDSRVYVVSTDMRTWGGPQLDQGAIANGTDSTQSSMSKGMKIDIIVSELLGSFGDNELSPECLDGANHLLAPDGISIPSSYSTHVTPLTTPWIHSDLLAREGHDPLAFSTPYVVMLHSFALPSSTPIQEVWSFHHPLPQSILQAGGNAHNARFSSVSFDCPLRGVIHGIAGYFETVLYSDIELSIQPETIERKSKDMISWFPMIFPMKEPVHFPD